MYELFARVWAHVGDRLSGPLHLRFILQPAAAVIVAVRCRGESLEFRTAWKDIGVIWMMAFTLDTVYQLAVFQWFYVGESVLIATLLALLPYVVVRESMARLARRRRRS